jgi:hypothetical protein
MKQKYNTLTETNKENICVKQINQAPQFQKQQI